MYEDYSNEINFNEYNADLVMANISNKPAMMLTPKVYAWFKKVLDNIQTKSEAHVFDVVLINYNKRLLANILSFMLPMHEIKLPFSESLSSPTKAEKCLLPLIKQISDPPPSPTSLAPNVTSEWSLPIPMIIGWKNLCIQHWNFWSFIQKLHFIQIGSCLFGYR